MRSFLSGWLGRNFHSTLGGKGIWWQGGPSYTRGYFFLYKGLSLPLIIAYEWFQDLLCIFLPFTIRTKKTNEQWKKGPWLGKGYTGDEKLPNYVGIIIPHYKDPVFNQPGFNWKVIRLFFSWLKIMQFRYPAPPQTVVRASIARKFQ